MEFLPLLLFLAMAVGVVFFIRAKAKKGTKQFVCSNCGFVGKPKKKVKGSLLLEIVLWLLLIVPGIVYSFWRFTSKYKACPTCGAANLIPADSPKGKQLASQFTNAGT